MVQPGLEEIAADEITRDLRGEVRKTGEGFVIFRVAEIGRPLLRLRTVEDVFLLAWGTDQLTYRAVDLEKIERWTAKDANWPELLRLHHQVHARPKGKPTYRLVTQMADKHGYLRKHAREALAKGLQGKLPASWRYADENAAVEVWLTIQGTTALCGLRLSDRLMRHRSYKVEHLPASLRPTVAAAMVRLGGVGPGMVLLDPMCGAGTILAEQLEVLNPHRAAGLLVCGGDLERNAVAAAAANLRRFSPALLTRWDGSRLPFAAATVDRIITNPPFGKQLGEPDEIDTLYRNVVAEYDRVLKPDGRVVVPVSDFRALRAATAAVRWKQQRAVPVRVLGQRAVISVWRKAGE